MHTWLVKMVAMVGVEAFWTVIRKLVQNADLRYVTKEYRWAFQIIGTWMYSQQSNKIIRIVLLGDKST